MSWSSRVVWHEGMFLRAQHFQQQDRWVEHALRARVAALGPYWWGLGELAIDRDALNIGRLALHTASGVFPDGTPFSFPSGDADEPAPLELSEQVRDSIVYLALPTPAPYAMQVAEPASSEARRLTTRDFKVPDTHSDSPEPADLVVGKLRLRLVVGEQDRSGYQCIAVARVREVLADRKVTLDEQFIPPALSCRITRPDPLTGFIIELVGMLNQRSTELAARLSGGGSRGAAEQADFLLLQAANRWLGLLRHWNDAPVAHPQHLYETLVQMAGEFATFTDPRRPGEYPAYRHDNLQASFAPVIADLRRHLAVPIGLGVVEIPLQEMRYGVRRGMLTDRTVLSGAFYLVVRAAMPGEQLRRLFPSQVKIGAIEQIRELVAAAVSGIAVRPLPVAPRQLPFLADATYFELDRGSPHWAQMQNAAAFAIHVSSEFPNLQMQLWSVR